MFRPVRTERCSGSYQLQGWDLQHSLAPWGLRDTGSLFVSPSVTWSLAAQSQPSAEPLLSSAQHCWLPTAYKVCTCMPDLQVVVRQANAYIHKIRISKCLYFSFLQRKKYERLDKILKNYALLLLSSITPLDRLVGEIQSAREYRNLLPFHKLWPLIHGNTV